MRNRIIAIVLGGVLLSAILASSGRMYAAATDGTLIRWLGGVPAGTVEPVRRGYGNTNHRHTTVQADCPAGLYAGGIVVSYGGTCSNECDPDGGIIRNIELVCKPLVAGGAP